MPNATFNSFLGIAKEATKGTAVAATDFIPVKSLSPNDHQTFLQDSGMRGSQVASYGQVKGVTWAEYDFGGDVYADTIGYPLAGILGDVATTGASAPYTTTFAVKNSGDGQPVSYTLTDYDVVSARQFTGMQFSDVAFTFAADGLLEYSAKAAGNISVVTGTVPTKSYSQLVPYANWQGVATIAGTQALTLMDGTVEIKRSVNPIHTVDGSANPYRFWAGPVNVSGKLSFVLEDEVQLLNYLNNSQPSLDLNFAQGSGASATQVLFHMSKAAYLAGQVNRGKDYISVDISYEAVGNVTDVGASAGYSPIKVTTQSAKPAGTYV